MSSPARFLHAVGKSTLLQGLTVPILAQRGWLAAVPKGEKFPVTIHFGDHQQAVASLRRLNNAAGHLQFRYEAEPQARLRDYLANAFAGNIGQGTGVLEITETGDRTFRFAPVSRSPGSVPALSLYRPHVHSAHADVVRQLPELLEIEYLLSQIDYDANSSQRDYNARLGGALTRAGWQGEPRMVKGLGLRCDFAKNGVWLEVEFGNARTYYQDYVKFLLAGRYQAAKSGILLCPTAAFAQLLCELGQRRAAAKRSPQQESLPSYSGMMSYEKAIREFPHLQFMLSIDVVIAGIDIVRANDGLPNAAIP